MFVCVCVCVCVCACVCVHLGVWVHARGRGIYFWWWWGGPTVRLVVVGTPPIPPSRENSAIPERKFGHKTQQKDFNILNLKMFYKFVIMHKNRIFLYFQNKVKHLHKNNNNDNNRVIPCQIIQYLWILTHLPLIFCPTLSPPADSVKMTNPRELQPSTLHGSRATETLLVWLLRNVKFKRCLPICWWRCGESVWPGSSK